MLLESFAYPEPSHELPPPTPAGAAVELRMENVGVSVPLPSIVPMSHVLTLSGVGSELTPIPATPFGVQEPARVSHRMSFVIVGLLNVGQLVESFGIGANGAYRGSLRMAFMPRLFPPVEMPAAAGQPLLVRAVAVVRFLAIVLLMMFTTAASSIEMPPPPWAEVLFVIMLLTMSILDRPQATGSVSWPGTVFSPVPVGVT